MTQLIITLIAGLILVLFYAYLIFTLLGFVSLILNVIIITALYFLIRRDLKDSDNHKYYIFSLIPTALFFISIKVDSKTDTDGWLKISPYNTKIVFVSQLKTNLFSSKPIRGNSH